MEKKGYKRITISFTDADNDIVEYLENLKESGKASEFVRDAIREKMSKGDTLTEEKVRDIIKEMMPNLISTTPSPELKKEIKHQVNDTVKINKNDDLDRAILDAIDSFEL